MNERIKELMEEALQLVADEHTNGDESRLDTDSYHVKDLIQEKFAELIVKECADKTFDSEKGIGTTRWKTEVMAELKEHFGIES